MSSASRRTSAGEKKVFSVNRGSSSAMAPASMDAWIDTYHTVRSLTRGGTHVFLTDSAVGLREEDNLRHLVINLGTDVPRSSVTN